MKQRFRSVFWDDVAHALACIAALAAPSAPKGLKPLCTLKRAPHFPAARGWKKQKQFASIPPGETVREDFLKALGQSFRLVNDIVRG